MYIMSYSNFDINHFDIWKKNLKNYYICGLFIDNYKRHTFYMITFENLKKYQHTTTADELQCLLEKIFQNTQINVTKTEINYKMCFFFQIYRLLFFYISAEVVIKNLSQLISNAAKKAIK